ncbi:MAG: hypothetical protein ACTHMS_11850 [Jatrophihabitans sp.]|uniref:hypothetical protein n=1 Tax=Jatrophihabitans sp. TaxID=1932789 RepID=UPI003F81351D
MARDVVVLSGALAQRPGRPGHTWVFLQYLLGLRGLGYDVHFVDRLPSDADSADGVEWVRGVMASVGLGDCWTVLLPDGGAAGAARSTALDRVRRSVLLLNVMGYLDDPELLAAAPRRVFLDIDPGFGQLWQALGLADVFAGHDVFATVGTNLPASTVPLLDRPWITTVPPVFLPAWPVQPARPDGPFTSVASWRGPFGPIEYTGRTYGLRVHEFRRFLRLPVRIGADFRLALDIDPADDADRVRLEADGWVLCDPSTVATLDAYRGFLADSAAELCIAKQLYVATRGGWFSDRSACYLASGRPVVMQDTGATLPTGAGLLTFSTPDEAVACIEAVRADHARHARAARELAESVLSTSVVLPRLLDAVTA